MCTFHKKSARGKGANRFSGDGRSVFRGDFGSVPCCCVKNDHGKSFFAKKLHKVHIATMCLLIQKSVQAPLFF